MYHLPWSLWLAGVGCAAAVILTATWMKLSELSGGALRKLEAKNPRLAERAEEWLVRRDEYRILMRLLFVVAFLSISAGFSFWVLHCREGKHSLLFCYTPPAVAALVFLLITEWLGRETSIRATARFLSWSLMLVRAAGVAAFPLAVPLVLLHRWARERRNGNDEEEATAEDEIRSLVEQDEQQEEAQEGALEADERRMIQGVFDLDETLVREIMTPRVDVDAVDEAASIDDIKRTIVDTGHSRIPVYHESVDQIVGIIHAKDLLNDSKLSESQGLAPLLHQPAFIPETKNIGDLLAEFQQTNNQFAVVLDEYGGTAGIVTVEDILEEIVGEIRDEYDVEEEVPATETLPDGALVVEGRMSIYELNDLLDTNLPEDEDYDTLGGYVSAETGRIPQQGEAVETDHLLLEILEADPRRVIKAKVRKKDEHAEDDHD